MIARALMGALLLCLMTPGFAQTPNTPAEDADWFNFVDASDDVFLEEGIACDGCRTIEEFRNAAITGCFTGYREATLTIFNWFYSGPTPAETPGIAPGPSGTWQVAGASHPCRYNVELRGNFRDVGAVRLWVCNDQGRCLLVSHQFVPECPGIAARIGGGTLSVDIVTGCLLVATGVEGLCTTVREENLNEHVRCLTVISDQGKVPEPLPPIPESATPPPPPDPTVHGSPGHNGWLHTLHCTDSGFNTLQ